MNGKVNDNLRTMQLDRLLQYYFGSTDPETLGGIFSDMKRENMARSLYEEVMRKRDESGMSARIDDIERGAAQFAEESGTSLEEMAQNPQFMRYLFNNGLTPRDAYYLANRESADNDAAQRAREELTASILSKKDRISENAALSGASRRGGGMSARDLSASEIDDIVRRVRKGEKITF